MIDFAIIERPDGTCVHDAARDSVDSEWGSVGAGGGSAPHRFWIPLIVVMRRRCWAFRPPVRDGWWWFRNGYSFSAIT